MSRMLAHYLSIHGVDKVIMNPPTRLTGGTYTLTITLSGANVGDTDTEIVLFSDHPFTIFNQVEESKT